MADLIDRQAAIDAMFANMPGLMFNDVLRILRTLPSAQPERKTGRWVFDRLETTSGCFYGVRRCSECGMIGGETRYCPFCGADMKGGNDETD